ncbi:MAG: regulatory iron-sulfur-containing complex subunit RicT [Bacteroidota bacterium]
MSCSNCSTSINGLPKGCNSNGDCISGNCGKLTVFDWLANMTLPADQEKFDIAEVRFKNGRKIFYKNIKKLPICIGDVVAVETSPGHDIGVISLTGELVKVQMRKKNIAIDSNEILQIYRKASQKDIDNWIAAREKEPEIQRKSRLIISRLGLKMKLSDVEFQGDGNKATFYYTADERVDFRQLIRELAGTFSIRVEMKQVGLRQEASRLGGIGSCGRELCCSTWLTDFRSVSTSAARYQQLSLNPLKLAGQCGKLKCCLNYELDSYLDALKDFPNTNISLQTEKGKAVFQKMDIFKGVLWYAYEENPIQWHQLTTDQTNNIISLNKKDKKGHSLEEYTLEFDFDKSEANNSIDLVGQDSLTRFDKQKAKKKRRRSNKSRNRNRNSQNKSK